jgi:FtsZ-binding cell division protein ZapB
MSQDQDPFEILENKINHLIQAYDALKAENAALSAQLAEKKELAGNLEERINRLSQEKDRAKGKIENLLGRLDRLILSNR